MRNQRIYW